MDKRLVKAFQEQINFETYSGYLYLSMYAWATLENWKGFAHWLNIQAQEERTHSYVMHQYLLDRGESPAFSAIDSPPSQWKDFVDVFEQVYAHEKEVSRRVNALATLAKEVDDHSAYDLLVLFVKEQLEEENAVADIITMLKRVNGAPSALYVLDGQLKARTFVFPFPTLNMQR